jgi:hypothetical protein
MEALSTLFVHFLLLSRRLLILVAAPLVYIDVCVIVINDNDLSTAGKLLGLELVIAAISRVRIIHWILLGENSAVQVVLLVQVLRLLVKCVRVQVFQLLLAGHLLLLRDQVGH